MYTPIQIPFILSKEFSKYIEYKESTLPELAQFLICFWEMNPRNDSDTKSVKNIIVCDGCIDVVVDFTCKQIGFAGMGKTDFNYIIEAPSYFIGARLKPGAFFQLTGIPAHKAMDNFISLESVYPEFDTTQFFLLPIDEAKAYFKSFLSNKILEQEANGFVGLFDTLYAHPLQTVEELADSLGYSNRQLQRIFLKHYALTPKMVLSILRFQKCLEILTAHNARPSDILMVTGYYDQPHSIRDFKEKIGITPVELIQNYQG